MGRSVGSSRAIDGSSGGSDDFEIMIRASSLRATRGVGGSCTFAGMWTQLEPAPIVGVAGSRVRSATTGARWRLPLGACDRAARPRRRGRELLHGHDQVGGSSVTHCCWRQGPVRCMWSRSRSRRSRSSGRVGAACTDHLQWPGDFLRDSGTSACRSTSATRCWQSSRPLSSDGGPGVALAFAQLPGCCSSSEAGVPLAPSI